MSRHLRPDRYSDLTVQTGRRLMQMSRLFVFLGQHFFTSIIACLRCFSASESVHMAQKTAKKQQVQVIPVFLVLAWLFLLIPQNSQAAVQGQTIFNSASFAYAEAVTPVVSGVSVAFVQRTAAQLEFLQFSAGSGVGTATAMGQTACQDSAGNFSTINTYQTLDTALHSLPGNPALQPVTAFKLGEPVFLKVVDADQNLDISVRDAVSVSVSSTGVNDREVIRLLETDVNSGVFVGVIQTVASPTVAHDCQLGVAKNQSITANYTDQYDTTDAIAMAVLVDPQGIVFNALTGAPIDGVTVTLWDITNNQPATVLGDDGVSAFPATVMTGSTVNDSSGTVYVFSSGAFRFPFVAPGSYRFQLTPPVNFKFPSAVSNTTLQTLAGAPFDLAVGSRGETFAINPGPIINIDIPLDPNAVALFIDKKVDKVDASIGDFLVYTLTLTNPNPTIATRSLIVHDQLPQGFHFRVGSAQLAAVDLPVTVDNTGRGLTFPSTIPVPADGKIVLTYVAEIGAETQIGDAVNQAWATGSQGSNLVQSNIATATVKVHNALFSSENILMGHVFVDGLVDETGLLLNKDSVTAGNGLADQSEEGLADVRIYLEDGRFVQTDKDGFYHFEGVRPGTHVVQLDTDSLPEGVIIKALANSRFSKREFSQFVDLSPGTLWRTNFRVFKVAPPAVPVKISQNVSVNSFDSNELDVTLEVLRHPHATLDALDVIYRAPKGWTLVEGSSKVNDISQPPEKEKDTWVWLLNKDELASEVDYKVHFRMKRGGETGEKIAQAVARFISPGSKKGSTAIADAVLIDVQEKNEKPREFSLQTHFDAVKTSLKQDDIIRLNQLIAELKTVNINRLEVEGHTDSYKIRSKWWHFFRNNSALSKARARSVANYLQEHLQLISEQIHVEAKGSSQPIADNSTEEGRASNRRAVIRVFASEIIITERTDIVKSEGHALGEAPSDWLDSREKIDVEALKLKKITGVLSPTDGQSLPFQVASVRVQLESRLKPRLFVDDQEISSKRIGFKLSDKEAGTTLYSYIGIDFGEAGEHRIRIEGMGPFGNVRFEKKIKVIRTGEIRRIIKVAEAENIADGKTRIRVKLELQDEHGQAIQSGVELEIKRGDLRAPVQHDVVRLREANKNTIVHVDNQGWVEFEPVAQSGQYSVVLAHGDVNVELNTFVKPEYRNLVMVGLAEGTLGYRQVSGHITSLPDHGGREGWYQDGRVAFYAKGRVKGKWLLTAAYDTAKTEGRVGNSLLQTISPDKFYTVYGDKTNQRFDAPSSRKLYLKLERDTFYALFGDFNTGLSVTELSRFTRTLNGIKSEWHKDQWGYKAFISQTSQTRVHDEILGDGTSGLYHLTRQGLVANAEKIVIETRDRFRSEIIHESRSLTRFIDYDIDYQNGTLFFKQPIMSRDSRFNPVYIVVDYETRQSNKRDLTVAGGRGYIKPTQGVELGVTAVQQDQATGNDKMIGIDANYVFSRSTEVKAEASLTDTTVSGRANAWKIELDRQGEIVNSRVYYRNVENGFGLGQTNRSENGTEKYGVDVSAQINAPLRVDGQIYRQKTQATSAKRDVIDIQGEYKIKKNSLRLGVQRAKDALPTQSNTSNTIKGGGTIKLSPKWSARLDHEQSIGNKNSVDYPTRTILGADFMMSPKATLFGEQEWARGKSLDVNISRLGVRGTPWTGAQLSSSLESRASENSERAFANVGLQQTWKINESWSIDGGVDRTQTLKDKSSTGLQPNPVVPLSSGGVDDFTALTAGASYRPEKWEWSGRLEYRTSQQSKRAGIFSAVLGDISSRLSATAQLHGFVTHSATQGRTDSGVFTLGAAWRPTVDDWIALDRFDVKYSHTTGSRTDNKDVRFVNNLNANWQANAKTQLAWQYGVKYLRETINGRNYNSTLDLVGAELEYNFNTVWDVRVNVRRLYSYRINDAQYHTGLSLGRVIMDNLWASVGYNFSGFYDKDFSENDFTAQGPFIKIRLKFDQQNLRKWLS